jgi:hypothetical protein
VSYHPRARTSGLRWREDTGIEKRCDYCPKREYWPLTDEFWQMRQTFTRCKACLAKQKYESQKRRYAQDAKRRLANLEYQRKYRRESKLATRIRNQQRYWEDPDRHRAAARERYYRNRDRILELKRLQYWASKAA